MPRTIINLHSLLQDFNPNRFIVYFSALIFTILLSLKLDNRITFSYWLVFLPLWVWKSISILGALIGSIVWIRNPEYRVSNSSYIHFKSMLISISLQLLLLMFEILVCDKLDSKRHSWTLTFVPLLLLSLTSIPVCAWSIKSGRDVELEFTAAINLLQFALIALKLDGRIRWSWVAVFVPTWVLLSFAVIIILYAMIFAAIVLRSPEFGTEQRRASIYSASSSSIIFLPILMFIILLTSKLDSPPNVLTPSYFFTCLPLVLMFTILIRLSFGSKSGGLWWFGMRTDFCTFLLNICPCLKEYGNTSFTMNWRFNDTVVDSNTSNSATLDNHGRISSPVFHSPSTDTESNERQGHENEAKRLLHSLSRVMFGHKREQLKDQEKMQHEPVMPKLSIEAPD